MSSVSEAASRWTIKGKKEKIEEKGTTIRVTRLNPPDHNAITRAVGGAELRVVNSLASTVVAQSWVTALTHAPTRIDPRRPL